MDEAGRVAASGAIMEDVAGLSFGSFWDSGAGEPAWALRNKRRRRTMKTEEENKTTMETRNVDWKVAPGPDGKIPDG